MYHTLFYMYCKSFTQCDDLVLEHSKQVITELK